MSSAHGPLATSRSATGIPTGRLAVWWVIASEIFIFGGLIASYLLYRLKNEWWAEEAALTMTYAGALNTFVLLTSSFFVVLAHNAAEKRDTNTAAKYLWYTIGGGFIFLLVKTIEYSSKIFASDPDHVRHMFTNTFCLFTSWQQVSMHCT